MSRSMIVTDKEYGNNVREALLRVRRVLTDFSRAGADYPPILTLCKTIVEMAMRLPDIDDDQTLLRWSSPDLAATVPTADGEAFTVKMELPDGTTIDLLDPLAAASAILSAWIVTDNEGDRVK